MDDDLLTGDPHQDVAGPAGPVPPRPGGSIRRTSTMDMSWPDGVGGGLHLQGRARDAVTETAASPPTVLAEASMRARLGADRVIQEITTDPAPVAVQRLVGERGGGHLRGALADVVPGERAQGTPLYLLLDDISGASLIAAVAWLRWPDLISQLLAGAGQSGPRRERPSMEGVCIGFRPGSTALIEQAERIGPPRVRPVGPLVHPADPDGWHELPELPEVSARRARYLDVALDGDTAVIDSGFQDSAGDPDHGRVAIHEYRLRATADLRTGLLADLEPVAHVLPFRECPAAVANAQAIVGTPVRELRDTVLDRLARTQGCTHLNDALRALAEVPALVEALRARS